MGRRMAGKISAFPRRPDARAPVLQGMSADPGASCGVASRTTALDPSMPHSMPAPMRASCWMTPRKGIHVPFSGLKVGPLPKSSFWIHHKTHLVWSLDPDFAGCIQVECMRPAGFSRSRSNHELRIALSARSACAGECALPCLPNGCPVNGCFEVQRHSSRPPCPIGASGVNYCKQAESMSLLPASKQTRQPGDGWIRVRSVPQVPRVVCLQCVHR